jgi:isoquinoline 1-oxidoreductase alpha subunit
MHLQNKLDKYKEMPKYTINVNSKVVTVEADADTPLLWVLRDNLNLVGTKFGCGVGLCGACTIHINGIAVRSCQLTVAGVGVNKVVTIEGLSVNGDHPVQKAWEELDVAQCGYCQVGHVMATAALLKANPNPSDEQIDAAITNICRCGTQVRIRKAIHQSISKIATK